MLSRFFKRRPSPLRGAPAVRRQKTYSAQTGFVYQYFYEGYRESKRGGQPGHEYVFRVSSDRKVSFPFAVFLPRSAVQSWEESHGRALTATEQYAAVKMALFQAFDDRPELGAELEISAAAIDSLLATLQIE